LESGSQPTRTCNGQCCVAFPLSGPLWRVKSMHRDADGFFKISKEEAAARHREVGVFRGSPDDAYSGQDYHTCSHLDPETRLCRIYERRPDICSGYPYGTGCAYCDYELTPMELALYVHRHDSYTNNTFPC
jgi:Fe-S-cluster containining protein